ncbi:MAG TPA: ABC transporter substrate-binding protein [Streptosporangiaceae bacterium]|nr:ABC transporter substrate-binding protein [Streptosporangiaceae bacterium]
MAWLAKEAQVRPLNNQDGGAESSNRGEVTRRQFLTGGAALGLGIPLAGGLLEACSSSGTSSGAGGGSGGNSSNGIVVGLDTDIDTLDPIAFRSDAAYEAVIQAYEMPVDNLVKPANGILSGIAGTLVPEAASNYSISADSTTYKFTVRPNVKFSNGNPVTADTLHYSYLRALKGPGYAAELMKLLTVTDASQLVVTGPMTFEIHLDQPNPLGPKLIPLSVLVVTDPALSKQQATKSDPWAANFYRTHMMGSGPYMQGTTWQSGTQYLLSRNPHYWNKSKVRNTGVLLKYLPSSDNRALLLQQGSIDVAFGLPASKLNALRGANGIRLINVPSRNWNYLGLTNTIAPLNDVRVRQAIAYALPYQNLIQHSLYGFASPLKGILASGTPTLDESLWPYRTNMQKAKSLLAAAGHGSGFQSSLTVSESRANDINTATYIQSALQQIGIRVSINQVSDADFRAKESAGELPMFIDYWYSWVDDPFYQMYWLLNSANKSSTNVAKYSSPQTDQLIKTGFYEVDSARRAQLSRQVQQQFATDVPYVPLYSENFTLAARTNISGINVFPDQYVRFWMLSKS